jgi:site-specific recombinase XerD
MSSSPALVPVHESAAVWGWVRIRALVVDSVSSPHSRRVYSKALDDFRDWCERSGADGFTRETVQRYRTHLEARGLAPSSLNLYLTVLRKLAQEAAANGILSQDMAASIIAVKGARQKGTRLGTWLTLEQAQALLRAPAGDGLRARRDQALLALLVGCGLRRSELATLELERIQQREGRWVIVDLEGKGSRVRSVPMPAWAKAAVDRWTAAAAIEGGRLFRAISQKRQVGEALTAQAVYLIVKGYAEQLGIEIAPHDLRRTFAKLAHRGRSPLEQIQLSLGHDSILTTERYLGVRQNLTDAPCDHLGIELEEP